MVWVAVGWPSMTAYSSFCLFVFVGLVVLGSVLMLLFGAAATLTSSKLRSCPEFDLCGAPAPDGNESLSADDPLTDGLRMIR